MGSKKFKLIKREPVSDTMVTYTQSLIHSALNSIKYAESYPQDTQITIILSTLAVEAFMNELGNVNSFVPKEELSPSLMLSASILDELEKNNAQIRLKLMVSHYALTGELIDKGAQPYQDFDLLVDIRNALVHPKPIRFSQQDVENDRQHKFVQQLVSRKVIVPPNDGSTKSWRKYILQPPVAHWAYSVATSIILDLIDKIPSKLEKGLFGIIEMSIIGASAWQKKYDTE
jgi:hypothetical protein